MDDAFGNGAHVIAAKLDHGADELTAELTAATFDH